MNLTFEWRWPRVLAHRGGGALAPENTLAAIDVGRAHGYRAIECDAMLAGDAVPVLIHDDTLERTTSGRGPVPALTAAQLQRLDAGSWFDARFAGARVPLLAEAIAHCRGHGVWMNIEIKPAPGHERQTGAAVAALVAAAFEVPPAAATTALPGAAAALPPSWPLLSSFSSDALAAAAQAAPGLPRGFLLEVVPADWHEQLVALDCMALHCDHRHLTATLAAQVKRAGFGLFCYTVNDPGRARQLLDWGVDAFCTDRIDLIAPDFAAGDGRVQPRT